MDSSNVMISGGDFTPERLQELQSAYWDALVRQFGSNEGVKEAFDAYVGAQKRSAPHDDPDVNAWLRAKAEAHMAATGPDYLAGPPDIDVS